MHAHLTRGVHWGVDCSLMAYLSRGGSGGAGGAMGNASTVLRRVRPAPGLRSPTHHLHNKSPFIQEPIMTVQNCIPLEHCFPAPHPIARMWVTPTQTEATFLVLPIPGPGAATKCGHQSTGKTRKEESLSMCVVRW